MEELIQKSKSKIVLIKYLPQLLIVGLILLVYIQNLWFDFAYLDDNLIVFSEYQKIDHLNKIPETFTGGYLLNTYYRPMVMISFIIDSSIAGQSSMMYHLTNIVLHIFVCIMLFNLLLKLKIRRNISLVLTLFFAIHPLNTNAVSWIVGRNDLLLALFSLISLLSFISFRENQRKRFIFISLVAYFFAMLSKEVAIILPVIFVIFDWFYNELSKLKFKNLSIYLLYSLPAGIYLYLRFLVSQITIRDEISIKSFLQNIYILFEYVAKIFYFPLIEPLPIKNNLLIILGLIISLVFLMLLWKIWKSKQSRKLFLLGLMFFLILLLPTLLVRIKADDGEFNYIDCRIYLPLVGFFILIGSLLQEFVVKIDKKFLLLITSLLFVYTFIYSFTINQYYKNGENLWKTAVENHPDRATYWVGYGFYYYDNKEYNKAAEYVIKAIKLKPKIPEYYQKAAVAYEKEGDLLSANKMLKDVLPIESEKSLTLFNLARNYILLGDFAKANEMGDKLLNRNDAEDKLYKADLLSTLSFFFAKNNQYDYAIKFIKLSLIDYPNNPDYHNNLGVFYLKKEMPDSAIIFFEKALALEPNNKKYQSNLSFTNNQIKK